MQSNEERVISFLIDTGADTSIISATNLAAMLGYSRKKILETIGINDNNCYNTENKDKNVIPMYDASKHKIWAKPVVIRNVKMDNLLIPVFRVLVTNKELSTNLLGMDFITAGSSTIVEDSYLEFTYWSHTKYDKIWDGILKGREAIEVNTLQMESRISSLLKQAEG